MSERLDTIADELRGLKNNQGLIDPARAVEWARTHPKSWLHGALCWDDEVAGERYRVWQVRALISVHILDPAGERRFVSLSIDRTAGGYREAHEVLNNTDLLEVMLTDAFDELHRVRRRFAALPVLEPLWKALTRVEEKHRPEVKKAA